MCYSDFNDIIDAIGVMDADVISIENSRSKMEARRYQNLRLSKRDRSGRLRHPLAARARRTRDGQSSEARAPAFCQRATLDQSGLRIEDAQMGGMRPALVKMIAAAKQVRAS